MSLIVFAAIVVLTIPQFGTFVALGCPDRPGCGTLTRDPPFAAGGIAYTILTVKVDNFMDLCTFNNVIVGWIATSMVCDVVITATLTTTLVCLPSQIYGSLFI